MSIADLSREASRAKDSAARSEGISCSHYSPPPGAKRCLHYLKGGACSRPDEFMCVEWLKANGQVVPPKPVPVSRPATPPPSAAKPDTDLFGNPSPELAPSKSLSKSQPSSPPAIPSPGKTTEQKSRLPLRGLTTQDIESFKALGVEVCLRSDSVDELWLVPDYTGRDRKEITPEHAATISHVLEAFPGSRVMSFEKTNNSTKETDE